MYWIFQTTIVIDLRHFLYIFLLIYLVLSRNETNVYV